MWVWLGNKARAVCAYTKTEFCHIIGGSSFATLRFYIAYLMTSQAAGHLMVRCIFPLSFLLLSHSPPPSAPPISTTYVTDAYCVNCSSYVASTTVYYPKGAIILLENDQINFRCLSSTSLLNKGVFQNTRIINKTSTSILNCDCLGSVFM